MHEVGLFFKNFYQINKNAVILPNIFFLEKTVQSYIRFGFFDVY